MAVANKGPSSKRKSGSGSSGSGSSRRSSSSSMQRACPEICNGVWEGGKMWRLRADPVCRRDCGDGTSSRMGLRKRLKSNRNIN